MRIYILATIIIISTLAPTVMSMEKESDPLLHAAVHIALKLTKKLQQNPSQPPSLTDNLPQGPFINVLQVEHLYTQELLNRSQATGNIAEFTLTSHGITAVTERYKFVIEEKIVKAVSV